MVLAALFLALLAGCGTPISADRSPPARVFTQTQGYAVNSGRLSQETEAVLHRFDQKTAFIETPDAALRFIHQKAMESGEHDLLFALAELNFFEGEWLRQNGKLWETRDARDYYLAASIYAWFYLFQGSEDALPSPFDARFRAACNLYNSGLGWALSNPKSTNAMARLEGGTRHLPIGQIEMDFRQSGFPWPLTNYSGFAVADRFVVRGLTVRNREPGLGVPLVAISKPAGDAKLARTAAATVVMRMEGDLADLSRGQCRASLELFSAYGQEPIRVGNRFVPMETDTTVPIAYALNQSVVWSLGGHQFLSAKEQIRSDVYETRPYEPGRVPVVFVHGTFSSPVWWAEMVNTLAADPVLGKRCQFWYFIYNSGNPLPYSATRLREALTAKLKQLDPDGKDPALQQMVVIGHSQGGLLTKLTATDTGDKLWRVVSTNQFEDFHASEAQKALLQKYLFYQPLPFVTRVVFISTPHRGSYLASNFARKLARKLVTLPGQLLDQSKQLVGLKEKLKLPPELKGTPTSLDSMSPKNPFLLALADIPVAPGVKANSIIAVEGNGDYHQGKDGLVDYSSAHVDYAESEFIVRSFHSCQDKPATIEEVRRILREHIAALPASNSAPPVPADGTPPQTTP